MATKPCPQCQTTLDEDDDFCGKCGAVLDPSLLADEFAPPTEPAFAPPPLGDDAPASFDDLYEELTGTIDVFAAAHVIFTGVETMERVDVERLTRLSAVLGVRADAAPAQAQLTPYERHVLSLINGNRSVARLKKKSGLAPQDVKHAIGVLAERGLIELKGELRADLRGLLADVGDDTGETALPSFANVPRTTPGVVLLDAAAPIVVGSISDDPGALAPPVEETPPAASAAEHAASPTPRFAERTRVSIAARREELAPLWASSLSNGWLFVAADAPPPAYTNVTIDIVTPEGSLSLPADVVHVQLPEGGGPGGAGLQITGLTKELRARVEAYLKGEAPLGDRPVDAPVVDASRLEGALEAARTLSNGNSAGDAFGALGLSPGCARDVVQARIDELQRLLRGPHPTATPPQAARCESALRILESAGARALADSFVPTPGIAPAPAPAPTPNVEAPPPAPSEVSSFTSFSSSATAAAYVPVPGMPGAPKPAAPASKARAAPAPAPAAAAPPPAAPPVNNAQRMRAMQILEQAVKELRAGKRASALTYIRMAAEIAPDDPQVKSLLAAWTGKG